MSVLVIYDEGMTPSAPGDERWHRWYWNRYNRPYKGCGCLYVIIIAYLIW